MKFKVPVILLQPRDGGGEIEHLVLARRVAAGGGSRGVIDGAVAASGSATWQIDRAPAGIGTRWRARIGGVVHEIDAVVKEQDHRPVWTLELTSTALTGAVAAAGPTS